MLATKLASPIDRRYSIWAGSSAGDVSLRFAIGWNATTLPSGSLMAAVGAEASPALHIESMVSSRSFALIGLVRRISMPASRQRISVSLVASAVTPMIGRCSRPPSICRHILQASMPFRRGMLTSSSTRSNVSVSRISSISSPSHAWAT